MKINKKFIKYVSDYQPELLSKPTPKMIKSETLDELPIILINEFKLSE